MKYKTEMHLHSAGVSRCATVTYNEIAANYKAAGYSSVVLTNHITSLYLENSVPGGTWKEKMQYYVEAYHDLEKAVNGAFNVLLGAELRFNVNMNDYLVYGLSEDFLLNSENLCEMNLLSFSKLAHKNGFLVFQAHPFRRDTVIPDVRFLDGVEAFNGSLGHNSRNPIANAWADYHCLLKTSGTDYHYNGSKINSGIETDDVITNEMQLVQILKSGKYSLIRKQWRRYLGNKSNIHDKESDLT